MAKAAGPAPARRIIDCMKHLTVNKKFAAKHQTVIDADLANLATLQAQLEADQTAGTGVQQALADAQAAAGSNTAAVAADQAAVGDAVAQLFADVIAAYGPPTVPPTP